MGSEWSVPEDCIGRIGNEQGFMKVKSRYFEAIGANSSLSREFVFNATVSKESRDDPLSHQSYPFIFTDSASS